MQRLADLFRRRLPPLPTVDIDYEARRRFEEREQKIRARLRELELRADVTTARELHRRDDRGGRR